MIKCVSDAEKAKIENLIDFLNFHTKLYDEGKPQISDKEWDDAYFELFKLENETGYILRNSPTQKIEYKVVNELTKVTHNHPMLSADKTKDWQTFLNYFGSKDVIGMLKLDGLTLSLRYVDGKLISAETRGDGSVGEDVLHNAKVIPSIPKYIDYKDELIIDGEIICIEKNFEPFKNDYANPRNFAAGSIRLLDSQECAKRNLTFVPWHVVKGLTNDILNNFNHLVGLGFTVAPWTSSFDWDAKDFLIDSAKELGYPIDGLIGRFADREYGDSLGSTEHHTKAIYAFKFYDEEYETRLKYIEWSMGRTGILTPVAVFEPLDIEGTVVNRASLHNYSVMKEIMGDYCYCGQKIKIFKANMIIPQISSAEKMDYVDIIKNGGVTCDGFTNDFGLLCPCCQGKTSLVKSDSGTINVVCDNENCDGKLINKLDHFCSKKGLDVKGLSKATIEKLIDWGWLGNIREIFSLSNFQNEWQNKSGFGVKSVSNILESIEASKNCTLEAFISGLGIPLVGRRVAKEICKYYTTWDDFRNAVGGKWSDIDGFGPEMERAINKFDYTEADEIAKLLNFKQEEVKEIIKTSAEGLVFVITGKMSKLRTLIQADIEAAGGKVGSSVTSKTNYLVCNQEENTTKYNKAKELNIPIITEKELFEII